MTESKRGGILEVFWTFLKLGCISFGGPVAHLSYYQQELINKRKWLSEADYAGLVALCQFLPGPASSQVGFAIGKLRAGTLGAFAAWLGFTLPSAILMISFALGLASIGDSLGSGWIDGLKLAAVAVVANAIWAMGNKLCTDRFRLTLAILTTAALIVFSNPLYQIFAIGVGALAGWMYYRNSAEVKLGETALSQKSGEKFLGTVYLILFAIGLFGFPFLHAIYPNLGWVQVIDVFYRSGSLVFGGGHVVLPLLEGETVAKGLLLQDTFLAGYGAAQAMPGPLFSFAGFLGASLNGGFGGIGGGILGLIAIYLPAWLLVLGILPFWGKVSQLTAVRAALLGANATVVGLLLAAFYDPIFLDSVSSGVTAAFALIAFLLLRIWKCPPWLLVIASACAGGLIL